METVDPAAAVAAALEEMPLFPLPDVVLFPGVLLPLHIFEPRYRALVRDCLASHRVFALVHVTDPEAVDANGNPPIAPVAGAGLIIEHHPLPDGRSTILLLGQARVHLEELPFVGLYRRARATLMPDDDVKVPSGDRTALLASATAFSAEVQKHVKTFSFPLPAHIPAGAMADHCAHHLLVDRTLRQRLLAETDPMTRVQVVTAELAMMHAAVLRDTGGVLH